MHIKYFSLTTSPKNSAIIMCLVLVVAYFKNKSFAKKNIVLNFMLAKTSS